MDSHKGNKFISASVKRQRGVVLTSLNLDTVWITYCRFVFHYPRHSYKWHKITVQIKVKTIPKCCLTAFTYKWSQCNIFFHAKTNLLKDLFKPWNGSKLQKISKKSISFSWPASILPLHYYVCFLFLWLEEGPSRSDPVMETTDRESGWYGAVCLLLILDCVAV